MSPPSWLKCSYLENVLRVYYKDQELKIIDCKFEAALGKGENYGATLTRINVKYQNTNNNETKIHERHLIAKTSIEDEDEFTKAAKSGYDVFNREMGIYEDVLPKLNTLLREIDDEDQLFPDAIYVDRSNMAIIFEDLSARGFKMADRLKRLDLAHVHLILGKLAKMHATSATLNERQLGCLERYDRGFFNRYTDAYRSFYVGCLTACARWLDTLPEYKKYATKLFALAPAYMEIGKSCFEPTPEHVNVLTHGDLWTNNVIFKYDEVTGGPIDVLLFDFQYAFWGSPTLDLHHLFNTSIVEELRSERQSELFKYFHGIFVETLKKLQFKAKPLPTLHKFHIEAEQKRFFAVHCTIKSQAVLTNEDSTDADFSAFLSEDERGINFKNKLYTNPVIQSSIKKLKHPELSYEDQMKQSLTAWQALETYQKAEYHPKNLKSAIEESATQQDNMEAAYTGGEEDTEVSMGSEEGCTDSCVDIDSCILRTSKTEDDASSIKSPSQPSTEEASQAEALALNRTETAVSIVLTQQTEATGAQSSEATTKEQTEISTGQKTLMPIELIMLVKTWNLGFDGFQNPFEFVERLEEMVQLYRVDIDQLPDLMPMFLSKDALTWYRNNRRCWETWEAFRTDLLGFFLPAKFKEDQKNAIRWRWQRQGESFKSYMLALQSLMRVTDLTEEEQLDRIYMNSRPELRLYVKRENFRTLPELISYASDYELICQQQIHQSSSRHFHNKCTCERCGNMDYWPYRRPKSTSKDRKGCYRSKSSFNTSSSNTTHSGGESSNDEDNGSDSHDDDSSTMPRRKPVKVLHPSKRHHGMNKDATTTPSSSTINSNPKNRSCTTDTQSRSSISKESTYMKRSKST